MVPLEFKFHLEELFVKLVKGWIQWYKLQWGPAHFCKNANRWILISITIIILFVLFDYGIKDLCTSYTPLMNKWRNVSYWRASDAIGIDHKIVNNKPGSNFTQDYTVISLTFGGPIRCIWSFSVKRSSSGTLWTMILLVTIWLSVVQIGAAWERTSGPHVALGGTRGYRANYCVVPSDYDGVSCLWFS